MDRVAMLESVLWAGTGVSADRDVRDGWIRTTTPGAPTHYRNGVLRSVLASDDVDARITETVEHFTRVGQPFRWLVTPSTRPRDMGERLLARGFEHFETLEGLVARPDDFSGAFDDVVEIGAEGRDDYLDAQTRAWGMPDAARARFRAEFDRHLAEEPRRTHTFVAYADGAAVGVSVLTLHDGFAHFAGGAVVPEHRGRGVYRRMIEARMAFLRSRGVPLVTNHCVSTTSAPICRRLGFEHVCDFDVYVLDPRPAQPPETGGRTATV